MDKDKSILEKFTDTVKDIANSASEALKSEEPPKVEQSNAAYMPFAAEGLVSDPLLIPPVAAQPPRRKRTARRTAKTAKEVIGAEGDGQARRAKESRKAAKTSARGKSKASSRSAAKASARRTTKRPAKERTRSVRPQEQAVIWRGPSSR